MWIVARQHPGESMAEWWCEGLLKRLVDPHDALAVHSLKVRPMLSSLRGEVWR